MITSIFKDDHGSKFRLIISIEALKINFPLKSLIMFSHFSFRFPCLDTVKLLLHCGANVECFDLERNSPLHTLAATFPTYRVSSETMAKVEEIVKLLSQAGVHLDVVNCDGATASEVCSLRKTAQYPNIFFSHLMK